ncbi:fluoride efflux transporter FluC [Rhodococcus aerolatus]
MRVELVGLVALGGAVGSLARHGLSLALPTGGSGWPTGTFAVNAVGAFLLGALLEALARRGEEGPRARALRLLAGTGFLGGFTTYSSLTDEVDLLLAREGSLGVALGYGLGSVVVGFVAALLGVLAATAGHRWHRAAAGGLLDDEGEVR